MFAKNGPTLVELLREGLCSTREGYDLLAPKFDVTPFRTPDWMLASAVRAIGQADAALDVCCGTGAGMQFLRPICRQKVVGIDFSPGMLRQARANLEQAPGTAKLEFVEGDVMEMNFQEAFDLVTCFGALGHIPPGRESAFLRRIRSALQPGGRFVFYTAYPPPWLSLTNVLARGFNAIMRVRNALLKPPFIMYYLNFLLPEIAETLKQEGFTTQIRADAHGRYRLVIATRR